MKFLQDEAGNSHLNGRFGSGKFHYRVWIQGVYAYAAVIVPCVPAEAVEVAPAGTVLLWHSIFLLHCEDGRTQASAELTCIPQLRVHSLVHP